MEWWGWLILIIVGCFILVAGFSLCKMGGKKSREEEKQAAEAEARKK